MAGTTVQAALEFILELLEGAPDCLKEHWQFVLTQQLPLLIKEEGRAAREYGTSHDWKNWGATGCVNQLGKKVTAIKSMAWDKDPSTLSPKEMEALLGHVRDSIMYHLFLWEALEEHNWKGTKP
jgi:hypothetical protein